MADRTHHFCLECQSLDVGWDAWVDADGGVCGGPYDHCQCMECGSTNIDETTGGEA